MEPSVFIKSSHDGTTLEFSDFSGDYYIAILRGADFHGSGRVYAHEPSHLAAFFRDLANNWRGWNSKKEWGSSEGELFITATSDSTGHTSLGVRLRSGSYPFDWTISAGLVIEAGQLEAIAKKIEEFLRAERQTNGSSQ